MNDSLVYFGFVLHLQTFELFAKNFLATSWMYNGQTEYFNHMLVKCWAYYWFLRFQSRCFQTGSIRKTKSWRWEKKKIYINMRKCITINAFVILASPDVRTWVWRMFFSLAWASMKKQKHLSKTEGTPLCKCYIKSVCQNLWTTTVLDNYCLPLMFFCFRASGHLLRHGGLQPPRRPDGGLSGTYKVGSVHDPIFDRMGAVQGEFEELLLLLPTFTGVLLLLLMKQHKTTYIRTLMSDVTTFSLSFWSESLFLK